MPSLDRQTVLHDLSERTADFKKLCQKTLIRKSVTRLEKEPDSGGWSIAECLEHLCMYGDYYIPEIRSVIDQAPDAVEARTYRTGFIGGQFATSMLPSKKMRSMRSPLDKDPRRSSVRENIVESMIEQLDSYQVLIDDASTKNLGVNRVRITISRILRLKLGDILQVVVYHNNRHQKQIMRQL